MKKKFLIITLTTLTFLSCERERNKIVVVKKSILYEIKVAGRYGLIDSTGTIIINPQFDNIYIPNHNANYDLIAVRLGNKLGFIDRSGHFKINPQFDIDPKNFDDISGAEFSEGLASVKLNNLYGFIDTTGKIVIKLEYNYCGDFKEGLAAFQKNKKWGFMDKTGKVIIGPQFDRAYPFHGGVAEIGKFTDGDDDYPSLTGFVNKSGKVIWQPSK